mmetsp:Transcript_2939/g.3472  ORF Transcript_2939/g.3472 Transcript_2939/m.3472 type:complete len:224 (-) Transcript_2939:5779-6450(-)
MTSRALLPSASHQVIDPVVLESLRVGVEAFRFGNELHLLIVVGSASIGGDDSPLKVGVLEVRPSLVVDRRLLLPALAVVAGALLRRRDLVHHVGACVANQSSPLTSRAASSQRLLARLGSITVLIQLCLRRQRSFASRLVEALRGVDTTASTLVCGPLFAGGSIPLLLAHFLDTASLFVLTRVVLVLVLALIHALLIQFALPSAFSGLEAGPDTGAHGRADTV